MASSRTPAEADSVDRIDYFLEGLRFYGKSERTRNYYERVLRAFESSEARRASNMNGGTASIGDPERNPGIESLAPGGTTQRECMAWVHGLRGDRPRVPSLPTPPTCTDSTIA